MTEHVDGCKTKPSDHFPDICRDGKQRPRVVLPEPDAKGRPIVRSYARSSAWGKPLEDLNSLMDWKTRVTLLGCVVDPNLVNRAKYVSERLENPRDALQSIANKALELGGAHEQSNRGTAVHGLTDLVDQGRWNELIDLPESIYNDLKAYRHTLDEHEVHSLAIETFTVQDDLRVAGTFDREVYVPDPCPVCGNTDYISDLKTSRTANYPHSWAVQLAVYANSWPYDIERRTRVPWERVPCKHRALLVHLPAHQARCDLYWIDIETGWQTATHLVPAVKAWRSNKSLLSKI